MRHYETFHNEYMKKIIALKIFSTFFSEQQSHMVKWMRVVQTQDLGTFLTYCSVKYKTFILPLNSVNVIFNHNLAETCLFFNPFLLY